MDSDTPPKEIKLVCEEDHNHYWEFQAEWSDPKFDGIRRYKCVRCGIWSYRQGRRREGIAE